jgi:hypothetical protein
MAPRLIAPIIFDNNFIPSLPFWLRSDQLEGSVITSHPVELI